MSSSLFMLGTFSCKSFFTPLLMPTGTTFRLLQDRQGNKAAGVSGACRAARPANKRERVRQCVYFDNNH